MSTQTIQFKLSLDPSLKSVWEYLQKEYEGLDKASLVRLAISNLAKTAKRQQLDVIDEIMEVKKLETGPSEEEFFSWWNKNKNSL